ncbi:DgyrCDS14067 [Dimorphilus gyrociliatus]|uniref:DgyrCDS14067 n=1 Tax=Dimorphilus gyrociliatus TaxID=2664684 RepID=A0A7I8WCL0_9ANNE|nr:DgyrCDS14067 [Dimorphilus gyrociliatus]
MSDTANATRQALAERSPVLREEQTRFPVRIIKFRILPTSPKEEMMGNKSIENLFCKPVADAASSANCFKVFSQVECRWRLKKNVARILSADGVERQGEYWGFPLKINEKAGRQPEQPGMEYIDVVVVGNGPSGLFTSYVLSGHWPYLRADAEHPLIKHLSSKISLIEHDLDLLSQLAVDGRSSNPIPKLIDSLRCPGADVGSEEESNLEWKYHPERAINHVVLGKSEGGGVWNSLDSKYEQKTVSKAGWMELPGLKYTAQNRFQRAVPNDLRRYYKAYSGLVSDYIRPNTTVTCVERVLDVAHEIDAESGEQIPCSRSHFGCHKYDVRGHQTDPLTGKTTSFCYRASYVVLATGQSDIKEKLGVIGEHEDYVVNNVRDVLVDFNDSTDPVLVVGAGLSAADSILTLLEAGVPVLHAFRRDPKDRAHILRKVASKAYPEYKKVMSLMKEELRDELYTPLPQHRVLELFSAGHVLLENSNTNHFVRVRKVLVAIGTRPDLSFLPGDGRNLGIVDDAPISVKHNPIDIDPVTHQITRSQGMFAIGALAGDTFVRFIPGAVVAVASHLWHRKQNSA